MTTLAEARIVNPVLPMDAVQAFGMQPAPLVNYVNHSKKIASEYMIKAGGKVRRVYSWLDENGRDGMYVLMNDTETFVTDDVAEMLRHGSYSGLTPVAQSVKVDA